MKITQKRMVAKACLHLAALGFSWGLMLVSAGVAHFLLPPCKDGDPAQNCGTANVVAFCVAAVSGFTSLVLTVGLYPVVVCLIDEFVE